MERKSRHIIFSKTEEDELEKSNLTLELYQEMVDERKEQEGKMKIEKDENIED